MKKDAWHEIGEKLDFTAKKVESKMKSLLAAYRIEKKEITIDKRKW